jgi:hypothetical protein
MFGINDGFPFVYKNSPNLREKIETFFLAPYDLILED